MQSDPKAYLPEDIIVHVARFAEVEDVLALKQTCRSIYSFVNSDYLWHQILPREDIPLAIPIHHDVQSYSVEEIQRYVLRALSLRSNWSQPSPRIQKWAAPKLNDESGGGGYDLLKLVNNGSILVAIKRSRHHNASMTLCAFQYDDIQNPRLLVHYSTSVLLKQFDASIDEDGRSLLLATAVSKGSTEVLQVHRSRFSDIPSSSPTFEIPYEFCLEQHGLFHKVSMHGAFAASLIMNHVLSSSKVVTSVILADWKTSKQITLFPSLKDTVKEFDVKIVPPYLNIIAASSSELRVTLIPLVFIEYGSFRESPKDSWWKRHDLPDFRTIALPCMDFYDICISDNSTSGPQPTLSVVAFPSISREDIYQSKTAMLIRVNLHASSTSPTDDQSGSSSTMSFFDVRMESFPEYPTLGTTGRRAVWLEQSLKSDYVQIVRLCSEGIHNTSPSLEVLIPPEPQLPFKPSSCRALAFDEASGRLCLASYKGEIFILDFA